MLPIPQLTSMLLPTMLVLMALPARSGGGGIHSAERKSHAYILLTEYSRDEMPYAEVGRITGPAGMYPFAPRPMSKDTLKRVLRRGNATGDPAWRKPRVDAATLTECERALIVRVLGKCSWTPTWKIIEKLQRACPGRHYEASTVDDAARDLGFTRKKLTAVNPMVDLIEQAEFHVAASTIPLQCWVNIDASHIAGDQSKPTHGRAPRGEVAVLHDIYKWDNKLRSVYAAVTPKGFLLGASRVLEGGIDDDAVWEWFKILAPSLNPYDDRLLPCSAIIMDNWTGHLQPRVLDLLEKKGVQVFLLTPRDPGSAPVELTFNILKKYLIRHRSSPLYRADPAFAIEDAMASVTSEQAANCYRHCGYGPSKEEEEQQQKRRRFIMVGVASYVVHSRRAAL